MIRYTRLLGAFVLFGLLQGGCTSSVSHEGRGFPERPRNIILMIADGAGPNHFTMARGLAQHLGLRDRLFLDPYHVGSVQTHPVGARITDSASSATAFATGFKTYNTAIAVDTLQRPLRTILEAAEERGLATGLVATSRITHATPAAFASHVSSRYMEDEIALRMLDQGIDVLLGGGYRHFLPEAEDGSRDDGRNLLAEAEELGYHVVRDARALEEVSRVPVMGLLSPSHMPYEIDLLDKAHLGLPGMVRKALDLLDGPNGFFLVIEGSRIDHASHSNDAAGSLRETLAYDEAFELARTFAEEDGETLVISVSDHETGGLSSGRFTSSFDVAKIEGVLPTWRQPAYGTGQYDWYPDVLARVSGSVDGMVESLAAGADLRSVLEEMADIDDVTLEEEEAADVAEERRQLEQVLGEIISRRALVNWATNGHTAVDVNLYAYGPGSEDLRGNIDNVDVGMHLFRMLNATPGLLEAHGP